MEPDDLHARPYVRCTQFKGVACRFLGFDAIYDEETGETEGDTSVVLIHMVGDDHKFRVPIETLSPLDEEEFCGSCGQLGCMHGRPAS